MKLPRLQYTYVVFYDQLQQSNKYIEAASIYISRNSRLKSPEQMMELHADVSRALDGKRIAITNYKLLSVRIVWR